MNKKIIIFLVGFFVLIIGFLLIRQSASYKTLTVTYDDSVTNLDVIILKDNEEIERINSTQSLRLGEGDYVVRAVESNDYSGYEEVVSLDESKEVIINPNFSKSRLAEILTTEKSKIVNAISQSLDLGSDFKLNDGKLYKKGDWYGTTIVPNLSEEELRMDYVDVFRIILKKDSGEWTIANAKPELVISALENPEIPVDVINSTNKLFGNEEEDSN